MLTREAILSALAEEREKLLARSQLFTQEELECPCTRRRGTASKFLNTERLARAE